MKPVPKPIPEDILDQLTLCEDFYQERDSKFQTDEEFYELEFGARLDIPVEYKASAIVLPTGRDGVDTFVDHIDLTNARVFANKKGTRKMDAEEAEMMRKYYLGVLYSNAVRSDIAPLRVAGKHYAMHGMSDIGSFWDADMWPDKPLQGDSETEEEYAIRLDEWRAETHCGIPIVLRAINPANILPDPGFGGRLYVIERQEKTAFEVKRQWPHWKGALGGNGTTKVKCVSYWDKKWRCEFVDGEPVMRVKGGVVDHRYGFIPHTIIESGLGNLAKDGKPEKRYVGILRYIYDLLVSESRSYSLNDVVLAKTALPWGVIIGDNAEAITRIDQSFGTYTPLPAGVELKDMIPQTPPAGLRTHLAITADYIAAHAASRSVRGMSEEGVRSRVDRDRVIAEGSAKYNYSKEAFSNGVAQVLIKCALLFKNVIPGDVRVWARTPTDEFDVEIDKDKMREPFTCYVEFAPISEEDEYRRHIDLDQQVKSGLVTVPWARRQMPNVDAVAMGREERKEEIRKSLAFQQSLQTYAAGRLAAALSKRADADIVSGKVPMPPQPPAAPQATGESAGRPLVPRVQKVPNQAEMIAQEMARQKQAMQPYTGQGAGGGGNNP